MATSNSTDLANLMGSVSVTGTDSAAQEALTNLLGIEIPLDAGVDGAASFIATKLGLQPKNSLIQTGVFVLTKAAILETASLLGVGVGLAKLDLISFNVAQLAKQVEANGKKLDVILSGPLEMAISQFSQAMILFQGGKVLDTIEMLKNVRNNAMQAFIYAKGQDPTKENIKSAIEAQRLVIHSIILIQSYDKDDDKIIPFSLLDKGTKLTISSLIENEVNSMQRFCDSYTIPMLTINKEEKAKKRQDLMDTLLRPVYPFISEGKDLTNSLARFELPCNLRVLPKFLPEGEEDSVSLVIGQLVTVKIWREGSQAFSSYYTFERVVQSVDITGKEEVTFLIGGQ